MLEGEIHNRAMGIRIVVLLDMCVGEEITPRLVSTDFGVYGREKIVFGGLVSGWYVVRFVLGVFKHY
jgi:hypothetical protein